MMILKSKRSKTSDGYRLGTISVNGEIVSGRADCASIRIGADRVQFDFSDDGGVRVWVTRGWDTLPMTVLHVGMDVDVKV